jgi:hypothetical protein
VLPEDGNEDENRRHEDDGQGDLRNGSRWKGLHFSFAAGGVVLFVPAGESCEEQETDERKNYGDDAVVMLADEDAALEGTLTLSMGTQSYL